MGQKLSDYSNLVYKGFFVFLLLLTSCCFLDVIKNLVKENLLTNNTIENNFEHKILLLIKIALYNAGLMFYLISLTIMCRAFDSQIVPINGRDTPRIKALNSLLDESGAHLIIFLIVFGFAAFSFVKEQEQMEEMYVLAFSWFAMRVLGVFSKFIALDMEMPVLKMVGWLHSTGILVYYTGVSLRIISN